MANAMKISRGDDDEIKRKKALLAQGEKALRGLKMQSKAISMMARGKVSEAFSLMEEGKSVVESARAEPVREIDITPNDEHTTHN